MNNPSSPRLWLWRWLQTPSCEGETSEGFGFGEKCGFCRRFFTGPSSGLRSTPSIWNCHSLVDQAHLRQNLHSGWLGFHGFHVPFLETWHENWQVVRKNVACLKTGVKFFCRKFDLSSHNGVFWSQNPTTQDRPTMAMCRHVHSTSKKPPKPSRNEDITTIGIDLSQNLAMEAEVWVGFLILSRWIV